MTAFPCFALSRPQRRIFTRHDAVRIDKLAVKSVLPGAAVPTWVMSSHSKDFNP
jgi:hypothetical protein